MSKRNNIDYKKFLFCASLGVLLVFIYFSFLPIISPDSASYYAYLDIFRGNASLSDWDVTRGPVFPLILYVITSVFQDNVHGFLIGTFIFYLLLLLFNYLIIHAIISYDKNKHIDQFIWFLFIVLIVFNPLAIGYYHTMLTEFVAPTVGLIACFLGFKWINQDFLKNRKSFVLYSVIFILLTSAMWLLKQPYVSVVFLPFLLGTFLSVLKIRTVANFVSKGVVVLLNLCFLLISISVWNNILLQAGSESPSELNGSFFTSGLTQGVSNVREIKDRDILMNVDIMKEHVYLKESEKNEIIDILNGRSVYENFKLYDVLDLKGEVIGSVVLFQENKNFLTSSEAVGHLWWVFREYPVLYLDSYFTNYLAVINVYSTSTQDGFDFYPIKVIEDSWSEHKSLGLVIYEKRPIYWWGFADVEVDIDYMPQYEKINNPHPVPTKIMLLAAPIQLYLFQIVFVLAPFLFIYFLHMYIKCLTKKHTTLCLPLYEILIILFGFSFLHVLLHAVTGALVDRYAFVAYPAALLGTILLFKVVGFKNEVIKSEIMDFKRNPKILLIIPAFNEAKNIVRVVENIKKSKLKPDFVVINDASKDDTEKICLENNYPVVSLIHNLGIGGAMQTGYKYALENDYDIAVQFDGDDQHDIRYLEQIVEPISRGEVDLCIGSRFLNDISEFKSTRLRRVGIRIISGLIFLVTETKVTDPTSGFRAGNKNVIRTFAEDYPVEYPEPESTVALIKKGYIIKEVPVKMKERKHGESSIKSWKNLYYMINVSLSIVIRSIRKEK